MKRLKSEARDLLAEQVVAKWVKTFTCQSGEWNCNKILEAIERKLRERRIGIKDGSA